MPNKICRWCQCTSPPHTDNCESCFGFGTTFTDNSEEWAWSRQENGKKPRTARAAVQPTMQEPFAGPCAVCQTGVETYTDNPNFEGFANRGDDT